MLLKNAIKRLEKQKRNAEIINKRGRENCTYLYRERIIEILKTMS